MDARGIAAYPIQHPLYPELLRHIPNPPATLYVRGSWPIPQPCITIVGTRKPSPYGIECAKFFTSQLAQAGFCIVSGLAFGIDAIAHQTALTLLAKTIAVLGSGPDLITPISNESLGQAILKSGGAIVSEFPPGTLAQKYHFPQRDRIMSGLSLGTLVIEAAEKSGALITARTAAEQGRDVFAVPGDVFSMTSKGTNALIKEGAKPVTDVLDIIEEFPELRLQPPTAATGHEQSSLEQNILDALMTPQSIDELARTLACDATALGAALTMLELKSMILRRTDGTYQRRT